MLCHPRTHTSLHLCRLSPVHCNIEILDTEWLPADETLRFPYRL
nr:MAG TPA: hypothetical protein [Caudoviricetes sp.]